MFTKEHFSKKFGTWSSGNVNVDKIIQESQINNPALNLQWIPYENFHDIEHIADSEYYTLHLARLRNEMIDCEDVSLKELKDYRYDILEFIKAIKNIAIDSFYSSCIARFFGISKNPSTQNYIIVMESYNDTIHGFLSDTFLDIEWGSKIDLLYQIIESLAILHENNLVHCDLHSRNISIKNREIYSVRIDPGLYADDNRKIMNKSHEQKLFRSLYNFHPQSRYISRHIYTLYELQDSLEDLKSGKCSDLNLYTYDMNSNNS
ncbi:7242_t:CDS:2 [Diversispora eburnea]|uniref:7242_t:CDS:1 n=1 Tax=Diversispora eburnea TaxID=1213867 RepID=A0A9N8WQ17_9GLOM|nr:7242_t:CDS:2 [Diversispora eburnea]